MKILITGGAGFIGSHLADAHIAAGDEVTALDDLSTGREANIAHLSHEPRFRLVRGTILDATVVDRLVCDHDRVYHLAAAVGVTHIVNHPIEALRTNIHGSEIVLDAVRKHGKKMLLTSTSEVYGKNTKDELNEDDDRILGSPLKSRWGYSVAKGIDELISYLYWKEYGTRIVLVRLFNTVGPRQTGQYGMVVPRFVRQALSGEDITVYGDGKQTRCFMHVSDCIRALVDLMSDDRAIGQVFNIGNSHEISMNNLAQKIIALTGSSSRVVHVPYEKAYEEGFEDMQRRVPSTKRLRALTGWSTTLDLNDTLRSVIEFERGSRTQNV